MIFDYMLQHHDKVIALFIQHVLLVTVAESIAVIVGITTGILVTRPRFKRFAFYVTNTINIGQSIPTLSVIGLTLPILGIGFTPAIFALFVYIVLPIMRNTQAGITNIDKKVMETGIAIGLTHVQIIRHVEIPLSLRIILAGIRTSTVFCISTASLVFLIGGGGLGELIFTGIELVDPEMIVAGAVPTALFALVAEFCFSIIIRLMKTHKSSLKHRL